MNDIFSNSAWPGLMLWMGLYISDYYLTIYCARMYRAQDKINYEGSFEITPVFQEDVNALKLVSPRFIIFLCVGSIFLWWLWQSTAKQAGQSEMYLFFLGAMILIELTIHIRHLKNWFMFSKCLGTDGIRGHMEYSRGILLRVSAIDLLLFSGLFLVLFFITSSWFVLGGAASCGVNAWNNYQLAKKHVPKIIDVTKGT